MIGREKSSTYEITSAKFEQTNHQKNYNTLHVHFPPFFVSPFLLSYQYCCERKKNIPNLERSPTHKGYGVFFSFLFFLTTVPRT